MWFKNIRIYRFTQAFTLSPEELDQQLSQSAFVPCNSQDQVRMGWVSPVNGQTENASFVHASQGYFMICAKRQEKVLPAAVINEFLADKVEAIQEAEGRTVGRKERQSLKDEVMMELLPKAFTRSRLQYAYIAPQEGTIVIDAASANQAEELLSSLRETVGRLPVVPLASKSTPVQVMTHWLTESSLPNNFTLGDECELSDPKESGSVIRCKQQELASDEINTLLQSGLIVTKLQVAWLEGISFILDDQLAIKRLRFEDNIREKADNMDAGQAEQFDLDFSVMTIELTALIKDVMTALGGINTDSASVEEIVAQATKGDNARSSVDEVTFA
ncbi:MAG: recombination-associated protein RdgC [Candidatus Thiodiazotropha endolucinida]